MNLELSDKRNTLSRRIGQVLGISVLVIGGIGIAGWLLDSDVLKSLIVGLATMKVNAALAFIFAGTSLWLGAKENPGTAHLTGMRVSAGMVMLIGGATLAEYIFGIDLGIDQLFISDLDTPVAFFPGRMSINTALNFTLLGLASLLLHSQGVIRGRVAQFLTLLGGSIAGVALIGYLYDVQSLYQVGSYSSMAFHTALGFFLLANGLLLIQPEQGLVGLFLSPTLGGQTLRRLLPFIIGVPLSLSLFILAGEKRNLYNIRFGLALMVILNVTILTGAFWLAGQWLDRVDKERQQAEIQIRFFARLYATLSQVNQTIVRVKEPTELFAAICKVAIEFGEFRLAWIGKVDHETGQVEPVAVCGYGQNKLPFTEINFRQSPFQQGLIGLAMASGQVEWSNDIQTDPRMAHWHETAVTDAYHSAAAIPIQQDNKTVAIFNLYATDINFFATEEEKRLLDEIKLDISFALEALQAEVEREKAQKALLESEARYHHILNTMMEGCQIIDFDWRYVYVNDTVAAQGQYPAEQLLTHTMMEMYPGIENTPLFSILRRCMDERVPERIENQFVFPDGSDGWFELSIQPAPQGIFILSTDITQRKRAERALQEAHDHLEQRVRERTAEVQDLFENAPAGYHSLDGQGNFVRINQTELNWLGYTREEMVGQMNIRQILTPDSQKIFAANFPRFKQSGHLSDLELEFVRQDGTILPVAVNAAAIFDGDGTYIMSRSTVFDITERKQAELKLKTANAELIQAANLKDEFLSGMSHELRTPLNGILSLAEALEEGVYGELTPRQLDSLRVIAESGHHLLALINDILDLSKIEAGKLELQVMPVRVDDICQNSLRMIKSSAMQKGLRVHYSVNSTLESLLADERRLKQMLVNLLGNAVKFTPQGGQIGLEVTADPMSEVIRFTVWDIGIGIAAEKIPLLFQPFAQLDSSLSRKYGGTGLGLSLVRRLAELHGGQVGVASELGQGSRFFIELPLSSLQPPVDEPFRLEVAGNENLVRRVQGVTALIVEDSNAASAQIARYLQELDVGVIIEETGEKAVERAAFHRPDVILLDILMPGLSGWEVLATLKADPRTQAIPVIIVSVVDEQARGLAAGAAEHLVKPLTRESLRAAVRRVLHTSKSANSHVAPVQQATVLSQAQEESPSPLILLVEDNIVNQQSLNNYLRAKGYRVILAANGIEAITQAQEFKPALILMDIQMPLMDGLEATRRLRAMPEFVATPIIALTALAMPGDRERCLEAGADDYLTKPVSLKGLTRLIDALLHKTEKTFE